MAEPLIYELSRPGRTGVTLPKLDVPRAEIPTHLLRHDLPLPEVSQLEVMRHFQRLSQLNFSIDGNMYPLGSCTMKYNPRLNEEVARLPGFAATHPLQDPTTVQGNLALMYQLQEWLREIAGMAGLALSPAAGAQGELSGVLMIRAYHLDRGDTARTKMLIPDSAHGTNPASTAMAGFDPVEIPTDADGNVDLAALKAALGPDVAGIMITNPNTLGLFEAHIEEVIRLVHAAGGLVYGDGANMNALVGIVRPGDLGFDVLHYNLHKTFSTPHGGGGPGSGPVGVSEKLVPFLPGPILTILEEGSDDEPPLYGFITPEKTIGRLKTFHGQFGMHVRAYTYIRVHGPEGLRQNSENAVLNANYLRALVKDFMHIPFDRICMHEFVAEGKVDGAEDIHALDIAKRLMDYDLHPPTNYFPLTVHEALLIEPTETETKETIERLADVLRTIYEEARTQPDLLHNAPHHAPTKRLDEVLAARQLVLCCKPAYLSE